MISQAAKDWDLRIEQGLWRSKDKTLYLIHEMTEIHIKKCISMLKEKLKLSDAIDGLLDITTLVGFKLPEDEVQQALDAVARVKRQIKVFEDELSRRQVLQ